jgi:hypothetical protein
VIRLLSLAALEYAGLHAHEFTLPHAFLAQASAPAAPASMGPSRRVAVGLALDPPAERLYRYCNEIYR